MANPYKTGERVLVSRDGTGAELEEGTVIDAHELLITDQDPRPIAVVLFEDGERRYMDARGTDIRPLPVEEADQAADADGDAEPDTAE
ncbi:MAG: hypothetical protein WCH31_09415 [Actinomycetes bacterium]